MADLVCGGFPCTDISSAGGKAGIEGAASGLWREFARVVREVRPRYVIVENSSDLLARGLGTVLGDLAEIGYDAEWHCIPAAYAGAPIDGEGRDRCWIVAYPGDGRCEGAWLSRELARQLLAGPAWGYQPRGGARGAVSDLPEGEPGVLRVADVVPYRTHRIACLGNAVYPPLVAAIGRAIMQRG
jgi:DNA (cytosine-5)-methyltransferase 1